MKFSTFVKSAMLLSMVFSVESFAKKKNFNQRIRQGVISGSLTKAEAKELRGQRKELNLTRKAFKADGNISDEEKAMLQQKKSSLNQGIFNQKHDNEGRKRWKRREAIKNNDVDARQVKQADRISNLSAAGQLNDREHSRLTKGQDRIASKEAKFMADGKLNFREKRKLKRMQGHQNRLIKRLGHNGNISASGAAAVDSTPVVEAAPVVIAD